MEPTAIPGRVTMLSENCVLHLTIIVLLTHIDMSNLPPVPQSKDWVPQQLVDCTSNGESFHISSSFLYSEWEYANST